jgi:hypothetical protein
MNYGPNRPYRAPGLPVHPDELVVPAEVVSQLLSSRYTIREVQNAIIMIIANELDQVRQYEWQWLLETLPEKTKAKATIPAGGLVRRPMTLPPEAKPVALPPRRIKKGV